MRSHPVAHPRVIRDKQSKGTAGIGNAPPAQPRARRSSNHSKLKNSRLKRHALLTGQMGARTARSSPILIKPDGPKNSSTSLRLVKPIVLHSSERAHENNRRPKKTHPGAPVPGPCRHAVGVKSCYRPREKIPSNKIVTFARRLTAGQDEQWSVARAWSYVHVAGASLCCLRSPRVSLPASFLGAKKAIRKLPRR